jgi:hypothetical protein
LRPRRGGFVGTVHQLPGSRIIVGLFDPPQLNDCSNDEAADDGGSLYSQTIFARLPLRAEESERRGDHSADENHHCGGGCQQRRKAH